jgi:hypothetical protein
VGWGARIKMQKGVGDSWSTVRTLLPRVYPFKYIMDGHWSYDADQQTVSDGNNINNVVEVLPQCLSRSQKAARARVLRQGGALTADKLARVRELLLNPDR